MGKPTGFLEVERKTIADRDPLQRLNDWREIHEGHDTAALQAQGSRCMDCGTPYCHTGVTLANMASGCPINNLIPEFNDLVYRGRWKEAAYRLWRTNNFPEFTGRVCPAPCEGSCVLGVIEPPVTIKNIECSIIDHAWEQGWVVPRPPSKRTGKKVAVVGSGPAGLSCADQLNRAGHAVTVFERDDRPGGLLMYGIPNMKLDKREVVERRIAIMEQEGVVFHCGVFIGVDGDWTIERLRDEFDAVALCCGATQPNDFLAGLPGRDADGIHFAMEFLRGNTKALLDQSVCDESGCPPDAPVVAKDKDVVVIGGGDTGTDCVGTSLRHGCRSVLQLEILSRPPDSRAEDNPWPEWPKIFRADYGQNEAKARFGDDPRQFQVNTKEFIKDASGALSGLRVVDVEWHRNDQGRLVPQEVAGSERTFPCQLVLLALGFRGPEQGIIEAFGLETDARSNVRADHENYRTGTPGVYSAGDMRRGQSLVVWAINEGRGCAREIDRDLMGTTQLP